MIFSAPPLRSFLRLCGEGFSSIGLHIARYKFVRDETGAKARRFGLVFRQPRRNYGTPPLLSRCSTSEGRVA
jgi:hypothetical protein